MIYLDANRLEQDATVYAITDWLKQNVGAGRTTTAANDWGAGEGWMWFGPSDGYERDPRRRECCIYFIDDPKKETLFRLKWGEYEHG